MMHKMQPSLRAVILTALPIEYQAVRAHLTDLSPVLHPEGTLYEQGVFSSMRSSWTVGLVEVGTGSANTAFEAERAIRYFQPSLILFVGTAGGIKDVRIGDVVANTKIYGYESGKQGTHFATRPAVAQATYRMEQRARFEARSLSWLQRIQNPPLSGSMPQVFVAPIATGEKVFTSIRSELYTFLRTHYNDAVAVEMEGLGMLMAARANPSLEALVIRGIADLIEDKDAPNSPSNQALATRHASAFAFALLASLGTDPYFMSQSSGTQPAQSQESRPSGTQGTNNTTTSHTSIKNNFHGPINTLIQGDHNQITIDDRNKPKR